MAHTQTLGKTISEEQRLKLENFASKREQQAQRAQQQQPSSVPGKKPKKQRAPAVEPNDWVEGTAVEAKKSVEETPAGQKTNLKPLDNGLHKTYLPKVVESAWYSFWETQGLFQPRTEGDGSLRPKGKYVIAMPPPNVTGRLHIGQALALSLEDTLVRWYRMRQFSTLYIPGCDHAGIATQAVVEKQLAKHPKGGKSKRQDFSRAEFVRLCQDWKGIYHQAINETIRRLGVSVDWSREVFTMGPQFSTAVTEAFVQLHSEGLIYRANRLVHWSCRLSTALSATEVDYKELEGPTKLNVPGYDKKIEFGTLAYFKYPIEGSDQTIEVATTRPETMLGDTAIAVHPQDDRYKDFVGKTVRHPIVPHRKLMIVADECVDSEFGTGAVKVTPAHEHDDFKRGKKHDLPFINILNEDGTLNHNAGPFAGEKRFNARYGVIEELKKLGLYTREEPNKMVIPICSRSGDIIEPLLKPQWWMKMEPLLKPAIAVVESGELVIRPEVQKKVYLQWMRDTQDWCLSRQLWWGHQIPAYHISIEGEDCGNDADSDRWVCERTDREAQEKAERRFPGKKVTIKRDEDVLDTWFSSGLWPFSVLGWPDKTLDLENYFPNTTLETGWDILPFWVSRMVIFSLKLTGKVPFTEVFCHAMVRDRDGRKMSKSHGNVIDPIDIVDGVSLGDLHQKLVNGNLAKSEVEKAEKYQKKFFPQGIPEIGADALRFSLLNTQASNSYITIDIETMSRFKRFCNKIYQATKYVLGKLGDDFVPRDSRALTGKEGLAERWILTKMNMAARQMNQALEERDFPRSARIIYRYLYDELFDIYIENSKSIISNGMPEEARSARDTLYTAMESGLRLLSPFMPFLTEELWQRLPRRPGNDTSSITIAEYPEYESSFYDPRSEVAYELIQGCSKGIRSLVEKYAFHDIEVVYIAALNQPSYDTVSAQISAIESLTRYSRYKSLRISILKPGEVNPPGCAVFPVSADANIYIEIKGRIQDVAEELRKVTLKVDQTRRELFATDALISELSKVQDKDVTEAIQAEKSRRRNRETGLQALETFIKELKNTII